MIFLLAKEVKNIFMHFDLWGTIGNAAINTDLAIEKCDVQKGGEESWEKQAFFFCCSEEFLNMGLSVI